MGGRGPSPKPTRLRLLHGETRPSRINRDEPRPRDRLPSMPDGMGDRAQAVWKRVLEEFGEARVITAVDQDSLRIYCEAVARYEDAAVRLAESGPIIRGRRSAEIVKNPLHQIVRDNADLVRSMARELGLTPAARQNLHLAPAADDDPLERWLTGKDAT